MIHLIVGNTGAGKTTYANTLREQNHGVIFSIDTWNKTLFLADKGPNDGLDWFLERIERSETMMMDLISQLEQSNTDSILDLGLSKFDHREKFRTFAKEHGYLITMHFLDVPKYIRLQRVIKRNSEKGETFEFEVSEEDFEFMEKWFEQPTKEELNACVLVRE